MYRTMKYGLPPLHPKEKTDEYKVEFTSGKAKYYRKDGDIDTLTEIVVCAGEMLRLEVYFGKSRTGSCVMEITSYFEPVLSHHGADIAHPAFGNLFIRTEFWRNITV